MYFNPIKYPYSSSHFYKLKCELVTSKGFFLKNQGDWKCGWVQVIAHTNMNMRNPSFRISWISSIHFFLDWSQAAPGKGNENVPRSLTQILTGLELEIQRLLENISWINYFVYIRVNTFVKIWLDSFLSLQLILIKNTFQYPISYHWRKQL